MQALMSSDPPHVAGSATAATVGAAPTRAAGLGGKVHANPVARAASPARSNTGTQLLQPEMRTRIAIAALTAALLAFMLPHTKSRLTTALGRFFRDVARARARTRRRVRGTWLGWGGYGWVREAMARCYGTVLWARGL